MSKRGRLRSVVGIGVVALLIRLLFGLVVIDTMPLMSDAVSYDTEAKELLRSFLGTDPFYWPPGLPALLAGWYSIFGTGVDIARGFMIVISTANVVLVYELACQLLENERIARWAGGIMAVYPPSVMMTSQVVSQPVEMTALLAATIFLLFGVRRRHWGWFLGVGGAFGVGGLVRPSLLSVVLFLMILLAVKLYWAARRREQFPVQLILGAGLGLLVLGSMLTPVAVYNHAHGGGWTLSTNNRYNLLLGNNPHTPLYKTSHLASRSLEELPKDVRTYLRTVKQESRASRTATLQKVGMYVLENPGTTLLRTLNRIRAFWGFDYVASRRFQIAYELGWWALVGLLSLEAGGYLAVMILVLLGLVEGREKLDWGMGLVGGLVIGYQIPYWIAFSAGTYHFTVVGLLVPFAALGATVLLDWIHGKRDLRGPRKAKILVGVLLLLQIEYAYFIYGHM